MFLAASWHLLQLFRVQNCLSHAGFDMEMLLWLWIMLEILSYWTLVTHKISLLLFCVLPQPEVSTLLVRKHLPHILRKHQIPALTSG